MRVYLVRWPDLRASLVTAEDEDHLLDVLDEVADSEGATWSVYRGPLWFDLAVPASFRIDEKVPNVPLRDDEIVVDDVRELSRGSFTVSVPMSADTAVEMWESVLRKAFPHLHHAFWKLEDEPTEEQLRRAVRDELHALIKADWSRSNRRRRTDPLGMLANMMGAPVRLIEQSSRDAQRPDPPSRRRAKTVAFRTKKPKP